MARSLTVYLIKYQKKQKEDCMKIIKQKTDISRSLVKRFNKIRNITVEDLTREYSHMDIKELCLYTKVRVSITRCGVNSRALYRVRN